LEDVEELGYDRASGFLWTMVQKKREHTFKASRPSSRPCRLPRRGVDVYIDDPVSGKVIFETGTGLSYSFPVSAFEPGA
ncbi:hypothetical protein Taro_017822, partial [Colocasia esculenta]|nr:hypothetical protein [Colocasia esculenta]